MHSTLVLEHFEQRRRSEEFSFKVVESLRNRITNLINWPTRAAPFSRSHIGSRHRNTFHSSSHSLFLLPTYPRYIRSGVKPSRISHCLFSLGWILPFILIASILLTAPLSYNPSTQHAFHIQISWHLHVFYAHRCRGLISICRYIFRL